MSALHLGTVKIPVTDLARSLPFYCDTLGLSVLFTVEKYGWVQLSGGQFGIALYEIGKSDTSRAPGGDLDFHMICEDRATTLAQVRRQCPDAAWADHVSGAYVLRFADPDGNQLHIFARGENEDDSLKTYPQT
ncbi:VOC family protein [Marinovum sp. 2_MG-2023]|uniref:VOC family protein n=1 Tax=unclassified Marinovum TaxID=2647166 RepID=UPI0026E2CB3A|nr:MULTISPECIES: VOC family protein [unclassified Marinovum]MDO6730576.1 VOC family protein [Marinovum sp. 2_MG-2023]MDO6778726.1 VOC family protein [Marinovum sp. 1_MG-2023]